MMRCDDDEQVRREHKDDALPYRGARLRLTSGQLGTAPAQSSERQTDCRWEPLDRPTDDACGECFERECDVLEVGHSKQTINWFKGSKGFKGFNRVQGSGGPGVQSSGVQRRKPDALGAPDGLSRITGHGGKLGAAVVGVQWRGNDGRRGPGRIGGTSGACGPPARLLATAIAVEMVVLHNFDLGSALDVATGPAHRAPRWQAGSRGFIAERHGLVGRQPGRDGDSVWDVCDGTPWRELCGHCHGLDAELRGERGSCSKTTVATIVPLGRSARPRARARQICSPS